MIEIFLKAGEVVRRFWKAYLEVLIWKGREGKRATHIKSTIQSFAHPYLLNAPANLSPPSTG
jgi:hypothetical protein